jgi:hypothetical protein
MKRFLVLFLFICYPMYSLYAQLEDYIVSIKVELKEDFKETCLQIADYYKSGGLNELSSLYYSIAEESQTNGFVYVDHEGENYIIACSSIFKQAKRVDIEIIKSDGEKKSYINCPILYINNDIDLTIIQFPEKERVYKEGLELDLGLPANDTEVYTAGYLVLEGDKQLQIAKGNITNINVHIPEITDPDKSLFLQHTAWMDNEKPDNKNAGCPLLIEDSESTLGYKVIGINTWLLQGTKSNSNNFYAIPSRLIAECLIDAKTLEQITGDEQALKEKLIHHCLILAAELNSEHPDLNYICNFVSFDFIASRGWQSYIYIINSDDEAENRKWHELFLSDSPFKTIQKAIFLIMQRSIIKNRDNTDIQYESINYADIEKVNRLNDIRTNFTAFGECIEIVWSFEYGNWLIKDMLLELDKTEPIVKDTDEEEEIPDSKESDTRRKEKSKPGIIISGGPGFCFLSGDSAEEIFGSVDSFRLGWTVGINLEIPLVYFFSIKTGVNLSVFGFSFDYPTKWPDKSVMLYYLQIPLQTKLFIPIKLDKAVISPFMNIGIAANFKIFAYEKSKSSPALEDNFFDAIHLFNLSFLASSGIEVGIGKSPHFYIGIEAFYDLHLLSDWENLNDYRLSHHALYIKSYIKYSF